MMLEGAFVLPLTRRETEKDGPSVRRPLDIMVLEWLKLRCH
jgi:hypothetical protein